MAGIMPRGRAPGAWPGRGIRLSGPRRCATLAVVPTSPTHGTPRRELFAVVGLLLALAFVQCAAAFRGWHLLGANDWNYYLGQTEAEVGSLQHWHQFPLWAPWKHGGQPLFAQPEAMLLSPFTLLALLTGTLAAYKLLLVPIFVVGALGMWALAGHLGLRGVARVVPALVLFGSSVFPLYLAAGLPNWLCALALLPWLVLCTLRAPDDLRSALRLAVLLSLVLFCGGLYPFAFLPVILGLVALIDAVARRSARPLLVLAAALLATVALAAPRLVPLFEVYEQYPRWHQGEDGFVTPGLVARAWASPALPDLSQPRGPVVVTDETGVYWSYVGAYVGPLALLLAAAGALAGRRGARWLLLLAACVWLALGPWPWLSAWAVLHELPLFGSMRASERLMVFATFSLAVLCGFGWDAVASRVRALWPSASPGARRAAAGAALAALLVPMLVVNVPIARHAFTVEPTPGLVEGPFRQLPAVRRPQQWGGECFESVRANVGNPLGMSDIPSPDAVAVVGDADYRGEVYLLSGRGAVQARLTPNVITVQADVPESDTLVVNQNHFPGWRAEGGVGAPLAPLAPDRNLLSLPLPAGHHELTLRYAPQSVPRGLVIGGFALLVAAAYGWLRRRGPVARAGWPEAAALAAFAGLAAAVELPHAPPSPPELPGVEQRWLSAASRLQPSTGGSDEQAALDAAPRDALVVLEPGLHAGLTISRPAVLMGAAEGESLIVGPLRIAGLAPGERVTLVGAAGRTLRLAGGLVIEGSGTVVLQSVSIGAADDAAVAVDGPAELYLIDAAIEVPLRLFGATAHALACELPSAVLRDGATLLLTGTSGTVLDADPGSRAEAEAGDRPTVLVTESRFMRRSVVVDVTGPPGLAGQLVLATGPALRESPEADGWLLADAAGSLLAVELTLDDAGHARTTLRVPDLVQQPGAGLFAQFAWPLDDGRTALSRPDGRLFALRESP